MRQIMIAVLGTLLIATGAQAQTAGNLETKIEPPMLTVSGHGRVTVVPDQALIRVGRIAQATNAATAQNQVNQTIQRALEKIKELKIPEQKITTVGLALTPVYAGDNRKTPAESAGPRIVGYRASNIIRIQVDDLDLVGKVIDAALTAGADELEGVSFSLRDDSAQRGQALRLAAQDARAKADAIADAMRLGILSVLDVTEGGMNILRPQVQFGKAYAAEAATPIQPGEINVEASITVRYRIGETMDQKSK
jgi:uncharacterized protein